MTVTYSLECSSSNLTTFLRLLMRWRGSIYKLLYKEIIVYLCIYFLLSFIYRFTLDDDKKLLFEGLALFCERYLSYIPLNFVLGFYVSTVVTRWWNVFNALAWVDRTALNVCCYVHDCDDRARMVRRTLMRYLNLANVLVLRDISSAVRKRFPTYDQLLAAGFINEEELKLYCNIDAKSHLYWVPIQWCCTLLCKTRREDRIKSDYLLNKVVNEVLAYRDNLQMLLNYDWISVPLVYTQVVTIATYGFFLACLMGRQYLNPAKNYEGNKIDLYIPIFTILQFLFYMGWLKVAEALINPLGEDDDDFEVNYIVERNLQAGYLIVDDMFNKCPKLERDLHWNDIQAEIPHTAASFGVKDQPQVGSAAHIEISPEERQIVYSPDDLPPPSPSMTRRLSRAFSEGITFLRSISRSANDTVDSRNASRRSSIITPTVIFIGASHPSTDESANGPGSKVVLEPIREISADNLSTPGSLTHL